MASKKDRDFIGDHIDLSNARLSDNDSDILKNFINNHDDFTSNDVVKERSFDDWSSDGRYTRTERDEYIFEDDYTVTHNYSYTDDDGQSDSYSQNISGARDIINILKDLF